MKTRRFSKRSQLKSSSGRSWERAVSRRSTVLCRKIWYVRQVDWYRRSEDDSLTWQITQANNGMGSPPKDIKKDWGLGGALMMGDAPNGGAKTGTMRWGGMPNL